jgi:hypothetical protein
MPSVQPIAARSSTEAKLGIHLSRPPILWCDSIGVTYLSSNLVYHAWTKHVEIDFYFVCDIGLRKTLDIRFISNKDQTTDIFSKPLCTSRFSFLRSKLTIDPLPLSYRGRVRELSSDNSLNDMRNSNSNCYVISTSKNKLSQ